MILQSVVKEKPAFLRPFCIHDNIRPSIVACNIERFGMYISLANVWRIENPLAIYLALHLQAFEASIVS